MWTVVHRRPYVGHFSLDNLHSDRLDYREMAARVLSSMFRVGAFESATCTVGDNCDHFLFKAVATNPTHKALARTVAASSAVLLKNEKKTLPISRHLDLVVVGSACDARQSASPRGDKWFELDYFTVGGSGRVHARAQDSLSILQASPAPHTT